MSPVALPVEYWWFAAAVGMAGWSWMRAGAAVRLGAPLTLDLMLLALACGIAVRWVRLGHGPFLSMFEVLASGMLTLGVAWRLASWRMPALRDAARIVMPLLAVMGVWMLLSPPGDTHLPATYEMNVLWFHVALGKVFLGCALVATALAGVVLARATHRGRLWFARMPDDATLDLVAWRFMLAALVFESLMLVAGAVWAQDAWGRYWAWDPLETWAFVTWLTLVGALHARLTWRVTPRASACMVAAVFVIAFLTFFGVPFVTEAPHQGAV